MKRLVIRPDNWSCTLAECPPGFFVFNNLLFLKTEYSAEKIEAFCDTGEFFAGGVSSEEERRELIVQPVVAVWEEA